MTQIITIISNYLVKFEIFTTAYIIGRSLVAYKIRYVADRCPRNACEAVPTLLKKQLFF